MSAIDGQELEVCPICRAIYFEKDWMAHKEWHEETGKDSEQA